jgi:CRISPR-associated endonuclease/helicase Cas3
MLFSVLVDADFTDTEEFCKDIKRSISCDSINELHKRLMAVIPKNTGSDISNIRAEVLQNCLAAATKPQGLFSLTVPTGGGKTLSSMAFALTHAKQHGLRRVIYVVPYTSIIEQNALVFKQNLGETNVLEHHSNFDAISSGDEIGRVKWASENWDIPVVVTTNVQFFESLFAVKTTKARKIHNIAKSVVVFDEAQMLPNEYLSPCMKSISELILNYGVTAVLCSATQPLVEKFIYEGLQTTEIAANPASLSKRLKRVAYSFVGKKTDDELVKSLQAESSALVIVNSRRHAFSLYVHAKKSIPQVKILYLSTLITPADRTIKIAQMKQHLKDKVPIIVISTQLIEAGVDVDFPIVYRSIAGIDSIVQAGGRANREGKLSGLGKVIVFESADFPIPRALKLTASIAKEVIECLGDTAFELEGVSKYFELLLHELERDGDMDKHKIMSEFEKMRRDIKMNFATAAKKFNLIESATIGVVVPCKENEKAISSLRYGNSSRAIMRSLQKYTVNLYEHEIKLLRENNAIEVLDNVNVLVTEKYYSPEMGMDIFFFLYKNEECTFI